MIHIYIYIYIYTVCCTVYDIYIYIYIMCWHVSRFSSSQSAGDRGCCRQAIHYIYIYIYIYMYTHIHTYKCIHLLYTMLYSYIQGPQIDPLRQRPRLSDAAFSSSRVVLSAISWALSKRPRPRDQTNKTTGDNVFIIYFSFSKRNGLWVWVSFTVLMSLNRRRHFLRRAIYMGSACSRQVQYLLVKALKCTLITDPHHHRGTHEGDDNISDWGMAFPLGLRALDGRSHLPPTSPCKWGMWFKYIYTHIYIYIYIHA